MNENRKHRPKTRVSLLPSWYDKHCTASVSGLMLMQWRLSLLSSRNGNMSPVFQCDHLPQNHILSHFHWICCTLSQFVTHIVTHMATHRHIWSPTAVVKLEVHLVSSAVPCPNLTVQLKWHLHNIGTKKIKKTKLMPRAHLGYCLEPEGLKHSSIHELQCKACNLSTINPLNFTYLYPVVDLAIPSRLCCFLWAWTENGHKVGSMESSEPFAIEAGITSLEWLEILERHDCAASARNARRLTRSE